MKIEKCPFCGGEADIEEIPGSPFTNEPYMWAVGCKDCNIGWYEETKEESVAAWNRRAQPENKPLTLNEIRGMFGKPVWIVQGNEAYPEETETFLVELFREERGYIMFFMFGNEVEDGLLTEHYGKTWRAYRSKPGEEV